MILSVLKRLTWVPTKRGQMVAQASEGQKPQPSFLTIAALLTFPGAALAVGIIWVGFDQLFGVSDRAVPIAAGYVVGFLVWLWGVTEKPRPSRREGAFGLFIAAINSTYLVLSVLGIDVGVDAATGLDPVPDHVPVGK